MRALWFLLMALAAQHHHNPSTCTGGHDSTVPVLAYSAINPGGSHTTCQDANGHFIYFGLGSTVQEGHNGVPSPVTGKGGIPVQGWYKVS
jgi:hypothetical protein